MRTLSGIKPTALLTLGNYLGAIQNWVKHQESSECFFMAVDLHSLTVKQEPSELRQNTYAAIATYLACGIDPVKSCVFVQSHVHEHAELAWILNCYSSMGELSRMTQFKEKSQKPGQNIGVGLFTYPVLMAADILLYQAKSIPVGADQKQHVELTRDLAIRLNNLYGKDLFVIPEPMIPLIGARIMDLQDPTIKMGKSESSDLGAIFLSDSNDQIEKKLKRAVTDSGTEITFEDSKPGVKNLLTIQSVLSGKKPETLVSHYQGKTYGQLKLDTADRVISAIEPIRKKTTELLADIGQLDSLLRTGAKRARKEAQQVLTKVKDRIGLVPPLA